MLCYKTEGEVIDVREKPGSEASTYHPVVKYRAATGEEITFEGPYGSSNWKVKPGDRLPLLVNRTNPNDAEVETFMAQWGLTLVFVVISVVGFIAAPIVFLLLRA